MAGILYHAADNYMQKLLDRGIKIAICDQVETPAGQTRQTRTHPHYHPGTRLADNQIEAHRNHFSSPLAVIRINYSPRFDLTTGLIASESNPEPPLRPQHRSREILIPEKSSENGIQKKPRKPCAKESLASSTAVPSLPPRLPFRCRLRLPIRPPGPWRPQPRRLRHRPAHPRTWLCRRACPLRNGDALRLAGKPPHHTRIPHESQPPP